MTLTEFLGRLAVLGPWDTRSRLAVIRNSRGWCPLQAVCRAEGMPLTEANPGGVQTFACRLGMSEQLVAEIQDASDGLVLTYKRLGAVQSEVEWLDRLRANLLTACGLAG